MDPTSALASAPAASREHKQRQRDRQRLARAARCAAVAERLRPLLPLPTAGLCGNSGGPPRVDWDSLPACVDPLRGGRLSPARGERKRWQIESVWSVLAPLVELVPEGAAGGVRIVDFGSGSGNFSLALAALLPRCAFTLVDLNAHATSLARQRADAAALRNVRAVCGRIETYEAAFEIAISLHACGWASDAAQEQALRRGAAYIVVPCCVGKLKREGFGAGEAAGGVPLDEPAAAPAAPSLPRSKLVGAVCTGSEFLQLAALADHESGPRDGEAGEAWTMANLSKRVVDLDRMARAEEAGWSSVSHHLP